MIFGSRVRGAIEAIKGRSRAENQPLNNGTPTDQIYSDQPLHRTSARERTNGGKKRRAATLVQTVMQVLVSLLVLGAALYIVLSGRFSADGQKWAYGVIGIVVGYWLS
jgi:hypothetical protein